MRIRSDFDVRIAYQICLSAHEAKISEEYKRKDSKDQA